MHLVSSKTSRKFIPSRASITLVALFSLVQGLAVFHYQTMMNMDVPEHFRTLSLAVAIAWLLIFLFDLLLCLRQDSVQVERKVSGSMSVNRWSTVELRVHHSFILPMSIEIFDGLPGGVEYSVMPLTLKLTPGKFSKQRYKLRPLLRGPLTINCCYVRMPSLIRLWTLQYTTGEQSQIKVYPDFSAISAFTLLATDNHVSQIGIKRKPRRGEGLEFLQLREYRRGDSLRQIDWKATSRRRKLISREYQDERDQQIVLLIDSGRRMRAVDDNLSHFDHSLNALLLVSHIALKQGDSVSALSFGKEHRWVPPQKGVATVKTILNAMYDLHAENCAPDYVSAAEQLSSLQRKRSLVILVTNTRDEEIDELLIAVKLLRKNHVILLANIREAVVDKMQNTEVKNLDDALSYSGVHHYLNTRNEVQQKIRNNGIYLVDCLANELPVRVANSYLEIKRAGVL